jgi:catechol 2,3-dioxygenase-like lactoylglutathione lyase family enzyme
MSYHHLALYAADMPAVHRFYEEVMGFELVKVEIAPVREGGWGKHFFYRINGSDQDFIAFWSLHEVPGEEDFEADLNRAAGLPVGTNHFSFTVHAREELDAWRERWNAHGLDVLEIDHNWCHSVYTRDPNGNMIEFCLTTGSFNAEDREHALRALTLETFEPSPAPASYKHWPAR